ncbi:hypothetical protein vseg_010620 [Gypsophila vaccaria]
MGLDTSLYGVIRSHQLSLDPLPTLNRAYHIVLQEERLHTDSAARLPNPSEVMAMAVRSDTSASSSLD